MNKCDEKAFMELLTVTAEMVGKDLSEGAISIWWSDLERYDFGAVEAAFAAHRRDTEIGKFMPKPSDIIRQIEGGSDETAMLAWAKVLRAITRVGSWEDVVFDDPKIHAVIEDMGGWVVICETLEDALPFVAKEFQVRYRGCKGDQYPKLLVGRAGIHNRAEGQWIAPPSLIGDSAKALQVHQGGGDVRVPITDGARIDFKAALARLEHKQAEGGK